MFKLSFVSELHWLGIVPSMVLLGLTIVGCRGRVSSTRSSKAPLVMLNGKAVPVQDVEAAIVKAIELGSVSGLSCAIINDGQIVYQKAFGHKDRSTGARNDEETIFNAASFSKPVFAYLVMLLAEEGVIDLDKPLYEYLDKPLVDVPAYTDLKGDERYKQITGRMALSHSTGFPNLRSLEPDGRLKFLFSPGERHSYSGEGILLLQMVVEEITNKDLETLAQEKIFRPLGMTHSSYIWQTGYEKNAASPHDEFGRPRGMSYQTNKPNAGGSMVTTAGDYARFISLGILNVDGKRRYTIDEMLQPQIMINYKTMFGPGTWQETDRYQDIHLAWGLGWGSFDTPYGRAFFHTGHGFGWQNYTVIYADKGIGVVLMSNSDNFERVAPQIVEAAIGDTQSPFDWLGYPPFDPSVADRTPPPEPVAIDVDPANLETYVGTYKMDAGEQFRIRLENDQLAIQKQDGEWTPLFAESETRFFIPGADYRFTFVVSEEGRAIRMSIEIQGLVLPPANKIE